MTSSEGGFGILTPKESASSIDKTVPPASSGPSSSVRALCQASARDLGEESNPLTLAAPPSPYKEPRPRRDTNNINQSRRRRARTAPRPTSRINIGGTCPGDVAFDIAHEQPLEEPVPWEPPPLPLLPPR